MLTRRDFLAIGATALACPALPGQASAAEDWPNRLVRIIVPNAPGSAPDILTRILAQHFQQKFGQPFVVENRTGAGSNIGVDAGAKSRPDGYTLIAPSVGPMVFFQYLYDRLPYDADRDLMPVTMTWSLPSGLVVPATNPARTPREFVEWAKRRPQGVTYSSGGVGTSAHLYGELFAVQNGFRGIHLPFRGVGEAIPAMLRGEVDYAIDVLAGFRTMLEGGQLRALAVNGEQRWPRIPDLPTLAESGFNGFDLQGWVCFALPAGTPPDIADRIAAAQREFAADPAIKEAFLSAGAVVLGNTPAEVRAQILRERPAWQELIRLSGARLE